MSEEQQPAVAAAPVVVKRGRGRPRKPVTLPPAGHAREEVLRQRTDALEEAAETRAAAVGKETIAPQTFRVIPELQTQLSSLTVTGALDDYVYAWVYCPNTQTPAAGTMVQRALAETVYDEQGTPCPTWEVVHGSHPEALERKDVMGYRRIGDVILMRCQRAKWEALEKHRHYKAERALVSSSDALAALGDKYGIRMYDKLEDSPVLRKQMAAKLASEKIDRAIRDGTMPGMPAPGR